MVHVNDALAGKLPGSLLRTRLGEKTPGGQSNNKPMLVPGEEGLRDIRILEAIYKSAGTGQRVSL